MSMPTFDLSNILRKLLLLPGLGFQTYVNPVRLFIALALALGALSVVICQFFLDIDLPFAQPAGSFSVEDSDIKSLIFYMAAVDVLYPLLDFFINLLASLIPFTITFFVSYFALAFTHRLSSSFRSWLLTMSGNSQ